jgi:hypothetical protein
MDLACLEQGFEELLGQIFETVSDRGRPGRIEGGPTFPEPSELEFFLRFRQAEIWAITSFERPMRRAPRLVTLSCKGFRSKGPCGSGEEGQRCSHGAPGPFEESSQMKLRLADSLEDDDAIIRFLRFDTSDENTSRDDVGSAIDERTENQMSNPQIEFRASPELRKAQLDSPARPELAKLTYQTAAAKTHNSVEIQLEIQVIQTIARATRKTHSCDFLDLDSQGIRREATGDTHGHGGIRDQSARRLLRRRALAKVFEQRTPKTILQQRLEIDRIEIVDRSLRARQSKLKLAT